MAIAFLFRRGLTLLNPNTVFYPECLLLMTEQKNCTKRRTVINSYIEMRQAIASLYCFYC